MQPYFFPYLAYLQLVAAVDAFVFLDDAQYTKGGWINRNRIAIRGRTHWWTRPVLRDSPLSSRILDRTYSRAGDSHLLAQLRTAYGRSVPGRHFIDMSESWLTAFDDNVAAFNKRSLVMLAEGLGCTRAWHDASSIPNPDGLRGQERVIAICRSLGASHYVNAIGGTSLYDDQSFEAAGLRLSFLHCTAALESDPEGAGLLSIGHELASRGLDATRERLTQFRLCCRDEALGLAE